jgi:hypothetical protein
VTRDVLAQRAASITGYHRRSYATKAKVALSGVIYMKIIKIFHPSQKTLQCGPLLPCTDLFRGGGLREK